MTAILVPGSGASANWAGSQNLILIEAWFPENRSPKQLVLGQWFAVVSDLSLAS